MSQNNIGFFYPTRSVGGAQYLFARMAEYLIEHTSYDVILIDYKDGFIRNKLGEKSYRFIEYNEGDVITIQEPLLLVLSLSFLWLIEKHLNLPIETKLFFWDLHPYNLVEQMALSGFYKRFSPMKAHQICALVERSRCTKMIRFVEKGVAAHGLAFMAERNIDYNQQMFGFFTKAKYLPIPIETIVQLPDQGFIKRHEVGSTLHIGWLSRLDSWKATVLFRVLDDIRAYENMDSHSGIHLHVIGDGPELEKVRSRCVEINASIVGRLEGNTLTQYMLSNLHVGFAMGTSALEFAVRGIPTVLTPNRVTSENLRQNKIYRWLFDSQGYDIAAEEMKNPESLCSFSTVVQSIQSSTSSYLGERCKNYAIENHHINNVSALFVDYLSKCTLTYKDILHLGLYQYSFAEQMLFALKGLFKSGYATAKNFSS
jgi:hypothetical protein